MTRRISIFQFRNFRFALVFAAFCIACVANVSAQERRPDRGLQAGNSYAISDIETVNLQNGNMVLNIPLASLPAGKGSSPGYTVSLKYNSKLWDSRQERREDGIPDETGNTKYMRELLQSSNVGGWHLDTGQYTLEVVSRLNLEEQVLCVPGNEYEYQKNGQIFKLELRLPDGTIKEFRPLGSGIAFLDLYNDGYFSIDPNGVRHVHGLSVPPGSSNASCNYTLQTIVTTGMHYYTNDGSGLRLFIPPGQSIGAGIASGKKWTLYYPDGRIIENAPADDPTTSHRITDRNGNRIYVRGSTIENDAGHKIEVNGDANGNIHIDQKGVAGALVRTTIQWRPNYVYRNYKASSDLNAHPDHRYEDLFEGMTVVEKVILPTQAGSREFNFDYNGSPTQPTSGNYTQGWGELKSIELPSGAEALYDFHLDLNPAVLGAFDVLNNTIAKRTLRYAEEYDGNAPLVTEETDYSIVSFAGVGSVSLPDGSGTVEYSDFSGSFKGYAYRVMSSNGTISEKIWAENAAPLLGASGGQAINAYVKAEISTVPDAAGNPAFSAIKEYEYDKNGNVLEVREYDWVPYSSITRTGTGNALKVTDLPSERNLLRKTVNSYYYPTPIATDTTTDSPNHYSNPNSPALLNLIKSTEVRDANGAVVSRSEFYYDGGLTNPTNGNLTETRVWDSFKGGQYRAYSNPLTTTNSISTFAVYDQYGNVTQTTDANNTVTQITYGNVAGPNGNVTGLYPTKTEVAANYSTLKRTSEATYDFYTGAVLTTTDVDNGVTNATEYDALGRPVKAISALGVTGLEAWTQTEYDDINRRVIVRSDLETKEDGRKVATQFFDQLGRVRLAKTLEDATTQSATNETDGIKVQTRYKTVAGYTYQLSSNPYRADYPANESDPTMGWTLSTAWSSGRRSEIQTFSGAGLPTAFGGTNENSTGIVRTDIDANTTTVTDQAGKKRRTVNNALGHLVRVDEPNDVGELDSGGNPVQPTNYVYDALNNLLTVVQSSQTRSFTYSSLSRMVSETNPEAGTTVYEFDNNGNPTKKIDSRGVSTHFIYDALNRVTQKSYTGESGYTTPTVNYTYDEYLNAIGRLTKVSSSISETKYTAFDKMGRVLASRQTTDGEHYDFQYAYNLAGMLVEQTYPSGRKVKNVFDNNGDLSIVQSKRNENHGFWNYAKNFTYNPAGAVTSMQLGNGQWQSSQFNSKLQMVQTSLGTTPGATNLLKIEFNYGTTANSGILQSQTITVPTVGQDQGFVATQNYTYDSLNRLKSATESIASSQTWKQAFVFDRFGNRNFDEDETTTLTKSCLDGSNPVMCSADRKRFNPSVNQNNNRLNASEEYSYDSPGNTTGDPDGRIFKYDGENKQYEVRNSSNEIIGQYYFDGGGKRIKKIVPSTDEITIFVYDAKGKLSAEYSTELSQTPQTSYITGDHLGSPRIKTDQTGAVIARNDYHPYGEEVYTTQRTQGLGYKSDDVRQKFTGYERDNEIGLDFAQARMYANQIGRFTTTDPSRKSVQTILPQTWNRYSYCHNNPIAYTDPNGKWPPGTHDKILQTALNKMAREAPNRMRAVERGSRKVDQDGMIPRTMFEKNAHEHAMTPGKRVREIGLEAAQKEARSNAIGFIDGKLGEAKGALNIMNRTTSEWKEPAFQASLGKFGEAMHTVMDNVSPTHTGFQVFDIAPAAQRGAMLGGALGPVGASVGAIASVAADQIAHARKEGGLGGEREPTTDEMNVMVDEIRYRFQQTYGQKAYEEAVSEPDRRATAERLARRGTEGMLVR